jgi:uncharacterized RDD family membrane protein YckC
MTGFEQGKTDTTLGVLTPEGIEFALFPAGLPIRTCAYAIDKIVQWILVVVLSVMANVLWKVVGAWFFLILDFCIDWFYHVFFELAFHGQSPGKRAMGLRVVRSSGAPVDSASSFLRNLLRFADTFMFFFPIALISMAASSGFRRLGDWAGGTLVVYTPGALAQIRHKGYSPIPGPALPVPEIPLSHDEKQAILMFARRYPLLGEARANEIALPLVESLRNVSDTEKADTEKQRAVNASRDGDRAGGFSEAACLLGIARRLSGNAPAGSKP